MHVWYGKHKNNPRSDPDTEKRSAWLHVWYGKHIVNTSNIHLCNILPKRISYHDSSVNSGEKSKQISTYTWRESKEIDINLYSTTIVNNYSAKQAVGKKKTKQKTCQNVTNYK